MNESRHIYEWVILRMYASHIKESFHIWKSHVTHEWVTAHTQMNHGAHMNESWHTYEWVMSHTCKHMNESCHAYEWVMAHIWMSHVTHMIESCHTQDLRWSICTDLGVSNSMCVTLFNSTWVTVRLWASLLSFQCIHMHKCKYINIFIYVYICINICFRHESPDSHVCVCVCACVCVCGWVGGCGCVCVCVYIYLHVHIYVPTRTRAYLNTWERTVSLLVKRERDRGGAGGWKREGEMEGKSERDGVGVEITWNCWVFFIRKTSSFRDPLLCVCVCLHERIGEHET